MDPQDIVPSTPQQGDTVSRHVFVSAQAQIILPLLARRGKDLFLSQKVSGISKAGMNVFLCKTGIVPQNLLVAPSLGEQIQNKLYRQSSSANDRFACQNGNISENVLIPSHDFRLTPFNDTGKSLLSLATLPNVYRPCATWQRFGVAIPSGLFTFVALLIKDFITKPILWRSRLWKRHSLRVCC